MKDIPNPLPNILIVDKDKLATHSEVVILPVNTTRAHQLCATLSL